MQAVNRSETDHVTHPPPECVARPGALGIAIRVAVALAAVFYGREVVLFYPDAELLPLHLAAVVALVTLWRWARRPPRRVTLFGAMLALVFASVVAAVAFNVAGAEDRLWAELRESGRARTACEHFTCCHSGECPGKKLRSLQEGAAGGRREDIEGLVSLVHAREPGYARAALALLRHAHRHEDVRRLEHAEQVVERPHGCCRHIDRQRWWTPSHLEAFGIMKDYLRSERLCVRAAEEARAIVIEIRSP